MEQHPVPRNISSFQFHLIGDMTLRQFAYMAGGAVSAFLVLKFFPLPGLVKWPIAAVFTFGGLAFAFLPIQERPLDKWLIAFIKSINSPTQYLWIKDDYIPDILLRSYTSTQMKTMPQAHQEAHADAKKKLETYLATLPNAPQQTINTREKNYLSQTMELFNSVGGNAFVSNIQTNIQSGLITPQQAPVNLPVNIISRPVKTDINNAVVPTVKSVPIGKGDQADKAKQTEPEKIKKVDAPAPIKTPEKPEVIPPKAKTNEAVSLNTVNQVNLAKTVNQQPPIIKEKPQAENKQAEPKDAKFNEIIQKNAKLEEELSKLKAELTRSQSAPMTNTAAKDKPNIIKPLEAVEKKEPTIKTVTAKNAVNEIGIPKLPQVPNLIMGVIKDMQNKSLPNIILTIKDTKGIPHRALKTNRLGQFSTATPLQNGIYHIEAEDPLKRYVFDIAEIKLEGKIFLPIEIDAKGEKELMREKLSKEIFGPPVVTGNQAAV